ncbi:MAG: hypothetical protein UT43_C0009G0011 [Parcubacteria group bacterium GW2011_GWC1_39_29]|uniref:FG-GAP repeat protein n=1 Tax=Candidatus Yanofskybacteria bacterium GW2011_GWD1_39_16 TaxID=1619030 RepID=A0A837HQ06_9BACT|nr:MAG: hypothetical protein UT35_C0005G0005 [Candidatus Yanofskybacteria bacterium GW2011_GWD1_39_16]KKR15036.1 MAG: hypothetical protein UT43_C0009G0011 [Parcubacteria group bacterium GW2011_GWC1_39_29]
MKKIIIGIIFVVIVSVIAIYALGVYKFDFMDNKVSSGNGAVLDPKNGTYQIEENAVTLKDGISEQVPTSESESRTTTEYFGNDITGDFNNDDKDDVAFILTQETGGSGLFVYVVVLLGDGKSGTGTNAIYLGDRIAPQTTEFRDGGIIVNYADRKSDEPFSAVPSVGVSKYFKVVGSELLEIVNL